MSTADTSHRILLAVTGLSPQVVTETLYALARSRPSPWIPREIHLITTSEGAERARLSLLSEEPGWFQRLCRDHELSGINFSEENIHVLSDELGNPLEDIRTPADNSRAADFICEMVRRFTSGADTELHVSIAGGRKTLGYYLGYALSLFGRPQDQLSHVLVSEPFESCWDFFYPTPYSRVIETHDRSLADTQDAQVTLANIPFVSLRHGLDRRLLDGTSSFSAVVEAARKALEPPEIIIEMSSRRICAGGEWLALPPTQLALLVLFARRARQEKPPLPAPPKDAPDRGWARLFLREYDAIGHQLDDRERTHRALKNGMDGDYFSTLKSSLHRSLRRGLGTTAERYLIDDGGTRPGKYRLKLAPEHIRIIAGTRPHKPATTDGELDKCESRIPETKRTSGDSHTTRAPVRRS